MKREPLTLLPHDTAGAIAGWASRKRRIRRVWMVGEAAQRTPPPGQALDLALEVEPVGDSEETAAIWMANEMSWRAQLERLLSRRIGLEWLDPDAIATPQSTRDQLKRLIYDRG